MSRSILVIDDDLSTQKVLQRIIAGRGWQSVAALDGRTGIELAASESFDVALLDLNLPDVNGLVVLQVLRERSPNVAVVMLTGHADVPTAVEAMQLGAENFLPKPFDLAHLEAVIERAAEKAELHRRTEYLLRRQKEDHPLAALGDTPQMQDVARQIEMLAPTDATLLLLGETGTGKGWTAELVHSLSPRAAAPFVEINCAGLSATFLDSELFGHEKGAFTDAKAQKRGLFEVAHGGTLFLDEIGDLALELQPKLLKVLESRRFRRLGGTREITADVRLIAATNHDLKARTREGRFREDLYYRVAAHVIKLPPLRERGASVIADLATRTLVSLRRKLGRGPTRFSETALQRIVRYKWPGNIRELRNDTNEVLPGMLPAEFSPQPSSPGPRNANRPLALATFLAAAEREHIELVLREVQDNRSRAAELFGVSRATLYEKLKRLNIA